MVRLYMKDEVCEFCIPDFRTIAKEVGEIMTDAELVKLRDGIEVLGTVLKCGEERLTCLPLLIISHQLRVRNGKEG